MLETIVTTYIDKHRLLPPDGEVIVGVSGGADSLCLLHLLNQLCGPGKRYPEVRLHAAHLNHRLRGEASDRDAAAVAAIVESWGVPYTSGEVDVAELARAERRSLEDTARSARYRFLREVAQGKPIAVAHQADDQVETLLLHVLRGSGLTGMVGMLPRQLDIIRPLLEVRHAQAVAYCQEHGIEPLEDLSNTDPKFLRNRIRHELVPVLEFEQLLGYHDRQERMLDLPHELRMVRSFNEVTFECLHGTTSTRDIAMLEPQDEKTALLSIPGRIKVQGTSWIATAELAPAKLMAEVRDALRLEDWSEVWRLLPSTHQVVYVDADVAGAYLEVRTRKPGDRIRPLGMQHEKKIQDIFVDKHVARSDRGSTPIFFSASHCIWLAGVCLDDRARLTGKTQQVVRLAIIKETIRWHQLE